MSLSTHTFQRIAASRLAAIAFAVAVGAIASPTIARTPQFLADQGFEPGTDFVVERQIAPGVDHRFQSWAKHPWDDRTTGPLTLNQLVIDLSRADLSLDVEKGSVTMTNGEPIDKIVERLSDDSSSKIVAGVNADFWATPSVPINMFVDEGVIWKAPWVGKAWQKRPVFAFNNDMDFSLGYARWTAEVENPATGQGRTIHWINRTMRDETPWQITAYTWPHKEKIPAKQDGRKILLFSLGGEDWLPNAPVLATPVEIDGDEIELQSGQVALSVPANSPEWLINADQPLRLSARFENLNGPIKGAVGGLPYLIQDGEIVVEKCYEREGLTNKSFVESRHPRTALGIMPDGKTIVLVTFDGRQAELSTGINLPDLAAYLKGLGCDQATNLDGGGSTSMWAGGEIVNFPSDKTGPRAISNALFVRSSAP